MVRREKEMNKEEEEQPSYWGTLQELLLACAVSRHGPDSWDIVSAELRNRTSDHRHHYTPPNCRRRYIHLCRIFSGADVVAELRRIRIEELRREVEKHDVSIEFLQLKLKRLEDEREGTDLSTEPGIKKPAGVSPEESVSGAGTEDRSLNESNSTTLKDEPHINAVKPESALVKPAESEPNGSVGNSVDELKKSSDNRKKRRFRVRFEIGSSSEEDEQNEDEVPLAAKQITIKCQPLIKILAILRSHKYGYVFERRIRSQESDKYKKMIRQHTDLQTIQRKLDKGFYLHSRSKFFRDLLLLFTNALIFFPKNSNEYSAASELRKLVATQMAKTIPKSNENKTQPNSIAKKPVRAPSPTPPIVVCRRRSSTGSKPTPNSVSKSTKEAKNPKFDAKTEERVIVKKPGVKEKNGKSNNNNNNNNNKKKKTPVKELDSSSEDETEDDDELIVRGWIKKDNKNWKSKLGKKGKSRKELPPVGGGKRGRESGGAAAVEEAGRGRKRPRK